MYELVIEDYINKKVVKTTEGSFIATLRKAEFSIEVISMTKELTRHPSMTSPISSPDYWMDSYNEVCLTIRKVK